MLPDQSLVVSTVRGGLVLLNAEGQLRHPIRSGAGLSEQLINASPIAIAARGHHFCFEPSAA